MANQPKGEKMYRNMFDEMMKIHDNLANMQTEIYKEAKPLRELKQGWKEWRIPQFKIDETETDFWVHFEIPGAKKNEIDISVEDKIMQLNVMPNEEQPTKLLSKFHHEIKLGSHIDFEQMNADYEAGILSVKIPKKMASEGKHKININ